MVISPTLALLTGSCGTAVSSIGDLRAVSAMVCRGYPWLVISPRERKHIQLGSASPMQKVRMVPQSYSDNRGRIVEEWDGVGTEPGFIHGGLMVDDNGLSIVHT